MTEEKQDFRDISELITKHMDEIRQELWSFTEALAETIDARTPYNANHVRKVAEYVGRMADYINELHENGQEQESFDKRRKEQLVMAALLHDIGKMVIPLGIMNKTERLSNTERIQARFDLISAYYRIDFLEGKLTNEEEARKQEELQKVIKLAQIVNSAEIVEEDLAEELERVLSLEYISEERGTIPYFTSLEKDCLRVERGTLTEAEREIMESHVVVTERILSKVRFDNYFADSPKWAVMHHEMLDGSGYPYHLKGEDLPMESRILAIADICDALLATDRPYKKPMTKQQAFVIMEEMAEEGKLDKKLVGYMKKCI
ncbi:MAG: HD domain-containing protein [Lachnospiraceae bacterium]|nr:HD domain-containing protein [Lachnospiraceae bacterium]